MAYLPAALVIGLGLASVTLSIRQREPRVPFIAILALIVLTLAAAFGMLVAFGADP